MTDPQPLASSHVVDDDTQSRDAVTGMGVSSFSYNALITHSHNLAHAANVQNVLNSSGNDGNTCECSIVLFMFPNHLAES